ncbi:leucine-rich repeat-containing protein 15-like [Littorina saxatilis]|uniref:Fibronectin type-III domain-containing protein n=1 Tax=Littorina saxatilis TaxID=31220 RepID=A0AAN9GFA3_9CAEN
MGYTQTMRCLLLLAVTLTLSPGSSAADPYQCQELRSVIQDCSCESKMFNNIEDVSKVVIACNNRQRSSVPTITGNSSYEIYEMTLATNNIQTIPARAFVGLRIQRLDLRDNRLTTINPNAFQGLESHLQELYIGAEKGTNIAPPLSSIINITALHTLHLEYFKFPRGGITIDDSLHFLTELKSLTLKNNELRYISPSSLPTSLTSLTLDHQKNLSSVPVDILRSLQELQSLTITHTLISQLSNDAFERNTNLKTLDLGYNKINTINANSFSGITGSLKTLSLRNNPIESVTVLNEVKTLTALTSLQLSEVGLTSMPAGAQFLMNKESLVSLHLEGNALTSLGPSIFTPASSLTELSLARNQLNAIDDQALAGLTALTSLDLSHQIFNAALALPTSLAALSSLKTLKLSGTQLNPDSLWDRISAMTSLTKLHVDKASLTSVRDYALLNLTQLQELNLDKNMLTQLTQAMLAGPRGLTRLTANNNQITTVSNCAFHGYTLSPTLSLELLGNPLNCDCKLDWLLVAMQENKIKLAGAERCDAPSDKKGVIIANKKPGYFTCVSSQPSDTCSQLYTTPQPHVVTTIPTTTLRVTNVSMTTISLQWSMADFPSLSYFKVSYMDLETSSIQHSDRIDKKQRVWVVKGLKSGTSYSLCVLVYDTSASSTPTCVQDTTQSSDSDAEGQGQEDDGSSSDVGIIVGVVVGVLVLLILIGAIIYITLLRKRGTKKDIPVQPHTFTSSELPGMSSNTRQFTRPKEKQQPKVGRALDENIKVTMISDGRTGPASPRDRQSAGSYQFLNEKHPNPNATPQRSSTLSNYSEDVGVRALPTAPQYSMKGYYNHSFKKDDETPSHTYNQIDL